MSWRPPPTPADFTAWKPDVCDHADCDAKHPGWSHHGREGPWLCKKHFDEAGLISAPSEEVEKIKRAEQPGLF